MSIQLWPDYISLKRLKVTYSATKKIWEFPKIGAPNFGNSHIDIAAFRVREVSCSDTATQIRILTPVEAHDIEKSCNLGALKKVE